MPVGKAAANEQIYVLDKWMNPVAENVVGELYIGGAGTGAGILGEAGLTAEKFVPDPFGGIEGGRLYRTGDLGRYLEDGNIEFLGTERRAGQVPRIPCGVERDTGDAELAWRGAGQRGGDHER